MSTNATKDVALLDCPACGASITAALSVEVSIDPLTPDAAHAANVIGTVKLAGLRMSHDCFPKAVRRVG